MAICASLLAGVASVVDSWRRPADDDAAAPGTLRATFVREAPIAVATALVPLGIALVLSPFGDRCGISDGILWYVLLVPPSAFISCVIALAAALLSTRRWLCATAFVLLWLASLVRGGVEAYTGPHMFLYAWQIGFFPGASWDAELPITLRLVLYRIAGIGAASALVAVLIAIDEVRGGASARLRGGGIASAAVVAVLGLLGVANRSELGLARTDAWLRDALGDAVSSRHAVIHYDASTTDSLALWRAIAYSDFFIDRHARLLGLDSIEPVNEFLYSSAQVQQELVGTSSASFTKPWKRVVNQTFARVDATLSHELAHVVLEPFGDPLLGVSISQGLLEGAAVALANDYGARTLHEHARALYYFGLAPPVEDIMGLGGFSSRRASLSYVLAGSFTRWLIERYGAGKFLRAYRWGSFQATYDRSLSELGREYRRFIDSLPPPDASQRASTLYMFGGGSFFAQRCLRRIGTLNAEGFEFLGEQRYAKALDRFDRSMRLGISYTARAGTIQTLSGIGAWRRLLDSFDVYARDTASYPLTPYMIEHGDALWALGRDAEARAMYDSMLVLDIAPSLDLRAALRLMFLPDHGGVAESVSEQMRAYFTRPMSGLQRTEVLARALDRSSDVVASMVLAMMRAAATESPLPATTIDMLLPHLQALDSALRVATPIERYAITELASELADGVLYAQSRHQSLQSDARLATLLRLDAARVAPPWGSRAFAEQVSRQRTAFQRFVRQRTKAGPAPSRAGPVD